MDIFKDNSVTEQRRREAMELLARQTQQHAIVSGYHSQVADSAANDGFNVHDFSTYPEIKVFAQSKALIAKCEVDNPYFRINDTTAGNRTWIDGKELINFSGYNYLGYSGEASVSEKAKQAIDLFGTSPSASRLASGEKPIHSELERALARFIGTDSALVFASGHATNVTVIGHFFNRQDLIIYDELSHNSVLEGCVLSGSRRISFAHNNVFDCERILAENIHKYQKIAVIIEGAYSMDGDVSPLNEFVALRKKYPILLYVDEAHSLGCVGETGRGISEYHNVDINEVDFWMGTLSKSLASNGGYIAGKHELIDYLKYTTPGFVYSAG